jgi:hypothetical protein
MKLNPKFTPAMRAIAQSLAAGETLCIGHSKSDAYGSVYGRTARAMLDAGFVRVAGIKWERGMSIDLLQGFTLKLSDRGADMLNLCDCCQRRSRVAGLPWCRRCARRDSKAREGARS